MTLKNKNKSGTADNGVQHQQQGGGKAFRLTKGLSGDNLNLIESFRKEAKKRPVLIHTINTILNSNGITDRVSADEKYISDVVNNSITRKVKRDCRNKAQTRQNLATKLQIEFLDYLKGLGTDGKPIVSTSRTTTTTTSTSTSTPTSTPSARIPLGTTQMDSNTARFASRAAAANNELESAERDVKLAKERVDRIKATRANQERELREAQSRTNNVIKANRDIHILHTNIDNIENLGDELQKAIASGNISKSDIGNQIAEFLQHLLLLGKQLNNETLAATNLNPIDVSGLTSQTRSLQQMINSNATTENISHVATQVSNGLHEISTQVEEAELANTTELERLSRETEELKRENEELKAKEQVANAAAKAAEAERIAAEAARTAAEAAQREAKKQSANNRTAKEASNAKAAELEQRLAALELIHKAELENIQTTLDGISYVPTELKEAHNKALQASNTNKMQTQQLLTNNITSGQPPTATLGSQKESTLLEAFSNLAGMAKSRNQAGKNANNAFANLSTAAKKAADTAAEIANLHLEINNTKATSFNEETNPSSENNQNPVNQYVVAVNIGNRAGTNQKPGNASGFNQVNSTSGQEEEKPETKLVIPEIKITEATNETQEGKNNSANPTITLNTHTAGETNVQLEQEPYKKHENNTPSSSFPVATPAENAANANTAVNNRPAAQNEKHKMRVALIIPTETPSDATETSTTNAAGNESSSTAQVSNNTTQVENTVATTPINVALVEPNNATVARDETAENKSANNFEQATETLPESEEAEEKEEPKKEVILALAPNTVGTSQLPELETVGSGEYLEILDNQTQLTPADSSGEIFEVDSAENQTTGGRKMTWSAVKRYFTPKKHHTKSKKSRLTLKVQSKKH